MSTMDIHLNVSEASSLDDFDCNVAQIVAEDVPCPELLQLHNDGSNAFEFLSIQIAVEIHCLHQKGEGSNSGV